MPRLVLVYKADHVAAVAGYCEFRSIWRVYYLCRENILFRDLHVPYSKYMYAVNHAQLNPNSASPTRPGLHMYWDLLLSQQCGAAKIEDAVGRGC